MYKILNKLALINLVAICTLIISGTTVSYAQTPQGSIAISPTAISVSTNQEFNISILISTGGADIVGADVIINYDSTKLQVVSITEGTLFAAYPLKSSASSQIKVSGIDSTFASPYNGTNGVLATMRLRALSTTDTSDALQIAYTDGSTTDSNLTQQTTSIDILSGVINSNVNIAGTADEGTPTPSTLPATDMGNSLQMVSVLFGISLMAFGFYWAKDTLEISRKKVQELILKGFPNE